MTKYIKTTDKSNTKKGPHVGYHDVDDDYVLPIDPTGLTTFEFVSEKEAKAEHPALFGIEAPVSQAPRTVVSDDEDEEEAVVAPKTGKGK